MSDIWAESAPEYKKQGKMYARVKYDNNGEPTRISVAKNQKRKAEFNMCGEVAVYDPHNVLTLPQAGRDVREYVAQLPFVEDVEMEGRLR